MEMSRQWTGMRIKRPTLPFVRKDFHQEDGHSSDQDQKRCGILLMLTDHKENGTESLCWWWSNLEKADTQFSVPLVHCSEERSKAKEVENYQYTSALMEKRLKLFRRIISVNQFSIYGAVSDSDLCEEYKSCHDRTGRTFCRIIWPIVCAEKFVDENTNTSTDDSVQEDLLQKYQERVDRLSQQNRVIKFCIDAGFLTTVDVGQYFMTKDTEEFSQLTESVACCKYILPIDEKSTDPKGWIRGNTKIGPVFEVTTSHLRGKYGVEIRNWIYKQRQFSLVGQNFSWLEQVGHGLEQQQALKCSSKIVCWRRTYLLLGADQSSKAKPQRRTLASSSTKIVPIGERKWTDIEPEDYSLIANSVSKQLSTVLRHGHLRREEDGAIEFWRLKIIIETNLNTLNIGLTKSGRARWQEAEATRKDFNTALTHQHKKLFISELFKVIQDAILLIFHYMTMFWFRTDFFEYIYHIGCANQFTLHHEFKIDTGRTKFGQGKTDSILHVCESFEQRTQRSEHIDLEAPRLAWYHQKKWKKHQNTVYWVDIKLAPKQGGKFYQTRSNAIIFDDTFPA